MPADGQGSLECWVASARRSFNFVVYYCSMEISTPAAIAEPMPPASYDPFRHVRPRLELNPEYGAMAAKRLMRESRWAFQRQNSYGC